MFVSWVAILSAANANLDKPPPFCALRKTTFSKAFSKIPADTWLRVNVSPELALARVSFSVAATRVSAVRPEFADHALPIDPAPLRVSAERRADL